MKLKRLLSLSMVLILLLCTISTSVSAAGSTCLGADLSNAPLAEYNTTYTETFISTSLSNPPYYIYKFVVPQDGLVTFAFDISERIPGTPWNLSFNIRTKEDHPYAFFETMTDACFLADGVQTISVGLAAGTYYANLNFDYRYNDNFRQPAEIDVTYALVFTPGSYFEVEDKCVDIIPGYSYVGFCGNNDRDKWKFIAPSAYTAKIYISNMEEIAKGCGDSVVFFLHHHEGHRVSYLLPEDAKSDSSGNKYFETDLDPGTYTLEISSMVAKQIPYAVAIIPPQELIFTRQPKNTSVYKGDTISVSATATGKNVKYQWLFRNAGSTEYSISSITTNTYQMTMTPERNGRKIVCVATDAYGQIAVSNEVTITMVKDFAITQQPQNVAVAAGKNAVVTVKADGGDLKYQWYYAEKGSSTFKKSSFTSDTYSVYMTEAKNGRRVYCIITDSRGKTLKTNTVTISLSKLQITQQPKDVTAPSGQQVKTTVSVTGEGLKYTWYFKNASATTYSKSSITTNTYTMVMDSVRAGRKVYCVITDKYGNSVTSNVATLSMATPLKITKQPANVSAANGTQVKTTLTATGDGLKYTWYFKNASATTYSKSSITTNTYTMVMDSVRAGRKVYCVITDKYGNSVTSNVVTLSMATPLKITKQPANVSAANGTQVKTTLTATGDGLKYTWYFRNAGVSAWSKSSLTGSSYSVTMKATTKDRQVYCVITDKYGNSVKSNIATLSMATPLTILQQPTNASAPIGSRVSTSVIASGDGLKYTWYICNPGNSAYGISSLIGNEYYVTMKESISGRKIYCVITDKYGVSVTTNIVTLTAE